VLDHSHPPPNQNHPHPPPVLRLVVRRRRRHLAGPQDQGHRAAALPLQLRAAADVGDRSHRGRGGCGVVGVGVCWFGVGVCWFGVGVGFGVCRV